MIKTDVVIIGAGLLGCFTARNLRKYNIDAIVIDKEKDVCRGISKANTGIIYTGYDNKNDTMKRKLCVQANQEFDQLCQELEVPFLRPGSLMVAYGPQGEARVRRKYESGIAGGIKNLELLDGEELAKLEPHLKPGATIALLARDTGVINPWELCIAAYENAKANGAEFRMGQWVHKITREAGGFVVETYSDKYFTKAVVNAAGLNSDLIRELVEKPEVRIYPTAADYMLLDKSEEGFINHVIFHEGEDRKGVTLVPTVDGNILIGPTDRAVEEDDLVGGFRVSGDGLEELKKNCADIIPELDLSKQIRSFASLRSKTKVGRMEGDEFVCDEKTSLDDFSIIEENGLYSLIGIKTPGLTFSNSLGALLADKLADYLGNTELRKEFDPTRKAIVRVRDLELEARARLIADQPEYGEIICSCMDVSKAEVIQAIENGATDFESVKRRTGIGMGNCQGSRCRRIVEDIIKEFQLELRLQM